MDRAARPPGSPAKRPPDARYDNPAWEWLNAAQAKLKEIRMKKLEATKNATAAKWYTVGDKYSREFFEFHKEPRRKMDVTELVEGGRSLRTHADIEDYIQRYYVELYTNDPTVDNNTAARVQCLSSVPSIISNEMNEMLVRDLLTKKS
jgi:hypothetical protein